MLFIILKDQIHTYNKDCLHLSTACHEWKSEYTGFIRPSSHHLCVHILRKLDKEGHMTMLDLQENTTSLSPRRSCELELNAQPFGCEPSTVPTEPPSPYLYLYFRRHLRMLFIVSLNSYLSISVRCASDAGVLCTEDDAAAYRHGREEPLLGASPTLSLAGCDLYLGCAVPGFCHTLSHRGIQGISSPVVVHIHFFRVVDILYIEVYFI